MIFFFAFSNIADLSIPCTVTIEHSASLDLFYDLPEVESKYCIGYGQREEPRSPRERPEEEFPEVEPLPADNPQEQDQFEERPEFHADSQCFSLWRVFTALSSPL